EEVAQLPSQQVATVADDDSAPATVGHAEVRTSFDREWERSSIDPLPMWTAAIGNPHAPEAELLPDSIAEVVVGRPQQRPIRLGEKRLGEKRLGEKRLDQRSVAGKSRAHSSDALDERAASFISARISSWSSASAADLPAFVDGYADRVLYYGSLKSRELVLQD